MLLIGFAIGFVAVAALALATRSTFRVEEGYLAVLVTFGCAETSDGKKRLVTYGPGLHWKKPWQKAITVSMKEQNLDLNAEEGGGTAMADDGTILRLDAFVRYVPVEELLYEHLFGVERHSEHIRGLFTCLLRNEIANFRGKTKSDPEAAHAPGGRFDFSTQAGSYALIRRERKLLNDAIKHFCEDRIDDRYGVRFVAVDLADILPPDEIADALNAVMQAQSEAEGALFRAEGGCQQQILAAERGVEIASNRAKAVEIEITRLAAFLDDLDSNGVLQDYVDRRRSEVTTEARAFFLQEGAA
ncbi:MAG: SPFH domain-containing protein [Labilithrix sp.]|nr:SPFH domain-containing protein [Labilithrix sp.]MCW5816588.1 SPFH domain-containing protein [Labilithrix sp.]